jgi:5-oxoprolinase (ATP-hydrolysing)
VHGIADRRVLREATWRFRWKRSPRLHATIARLGAEAEQGLRAQGIGTATLRREASISIRPASSENAVEVAHASLAGDAGGLCTSLARTHSASPQKGRWLPKRCAWRPSQQSTGRSGDPVARGFGGPLRTCRTFYGRALGIRRHFYRREQLATGFTASGPVLIVDPYSTTVVEPGWDVRGGWPGQPCPSSSSRSRPGTAGLVDASPGRRGPGATRNHVRAVHGESPKRWARRCSTARVP